MCKCALITWHFLFRIQCVFVFSWAWEIFLFFMLNVQKWHFTRLIFNIVCHLNITFEWSQENKNELIFFFAFFIKGSITWPQLVWFGSFKQMLWINWGRLSFSGFVWITIWSTFKVWNYFNIIELKLKKI